MVEVLVIIDGASEPTGRQSTSLERAQTPVLDRLARGGTLTRVQTVPTGLPVGSETAISALLGWPPSGIVDRGRLEAAAREVALRDGHRAWRADVVEDSGGRADEGAVEHAMTDLADRLDRHVVRRIGGHRLLVTGPPPLPVDVRTRLRVWPEGAVPPRILTPDTVVVAARGAAAGIARLMGATVFVPEGATGSIDTNITAKANAALDAIGARARRVVVHVAAPDEAAHRCDALAKVAAIERIDRELLAPLVDALVRSAATLRVCPDHGCDPHTGLHCPDPVPHVEWTNGVRRPTEGRRLTERTVARLPVVSLECLRAS